VSWISLATVKQYLQVSHSQEDDALQILVDGAQGYLAEASGIHMSNTATSGGESFVEDLHGGNLSLRPRHLPIRSVTRILDTEDDDAEVTEDYKNTQMRIVREDEDEEWETGSNRYQVSYLGGFGVSDTDPRVSALKMLLLELCHLKYHGRGEDFDALARSSGVQKSIGKLSMKLPFE